MMQVEHHGKVKPLVSRMMKQHSNIGRRWCSYGYCGSIVSVENQMQMWVQLAKKKNLEGVFLLEIEHGSLG